MHWAGLVIHTTPNGTVVSAEYAVDAATGYARPIIPAQPAETAANVAIWPGPGVWDSSLSQSLLWWIGVYPDGSSENACGGGFATGTFAQAQSGNVTFQRIHNDVIVKNDDYQTPDEIVAGRDGKFMYVFMLRGPPMGRDVVVAQVPVGHLLDSADQVLYTLQCWATVVCDVVHALMFNSERNLTTCLGCAHQTNFRYWDGSSFSTSMEAAQALIHGFGAQVSVVWNEFLGAWCILDSGFFSQQLTIRTATQVTGPWSEPIQVRHRHGHCVL